MGDSMFNGNGDDYPMMSGDDIADSETKLHVYRLPDFELDGRTDQNARRMFAATLPDCGDFERRIQAACGFGHYRVEKRIAGKMKESTTVHLQKPSALEIKEAVPAPVNVHLAAPQADIAEQIKNGVLGALQTSQELMANNQKQAVEAMRASLEMLRTVREVSNELAPPPVAPVVQAAPSAPVSREMTTTQALLTLAAEDPDMLSSVKAKLLGVPEEKEAVGGFFDAVKPYLPALVPALVDFVGNIGKLAGNASGSAPTSRSVPDREFIGTSEDGYPLFRIRTPDGQFRIVKQLPPTGTPAAPPAEPVSMMTAEPEATEEPTADAVEEAEADIEAILNDLLLSCAMGENVEDVAADLFETMETSQAVAFYGRTFAAMTTEEAAAFLIDAYPGAKRILDMEGSKEWLSALQKRLGELISPPAPMSVVAVEPEAEGKPPVERPARKRAARAEG